MSDRPSLSTMDLDDNESAPPRRRRTTKATSPRSFLLAILAFAAFLYASKRAWSIVKNGTDFVKASNPHVAHHHQSNGTAIPEHELEHIVRSFFGPGGVETFSLVATIFFQAEKNSELDEEGNSIWLPWERVFSEVVLEGLDVNAEGSKVNAKVTLPARIVPLLRNGRESTLLANFHLLPSSLTQLPNHLIPLNATYFHNFPFANREAMIAEGDPDVLPLPWPAVGTTVAAQAHEEKSWVGLLQQHSRPRTLTRRVLTQSPKAPEDGFENSVNWDEVDGDLEVGGDGDEWDFEAAWPRFVEQRVVTRSMVTLVRDFPIYSLEKFRRKQKSLAGTIRRCGLRIPGQTGCSRGFDTIGHMEFLVEMGLESLEESSKRWTYLPFLETHVGGGGPLDVVALPAGDVEDDFTFDWRISFASLTPLRVALANNYIGAPHRDGDIFEPKSAAEIHRNLFLQDGAAFVNALSGHTFENEARPLLRFFLRRLSSFFAIAAFLVNAHYWWTRTTTVGISIPVQILESIRSVGFALISARHGIESTFQLFVFFAVVAEFVVVLSLGARLEWSWGGLGGWVSVGVGRRRATHAERASSRVDAKFGWTLRALLSLLFFLVAVLYLPKLPHLIPAFPPSSPTVGPGSQRNKDGTSIPYLAPANRSFLLTLFLSQFLLNQRSKTFAGTHKIAAALELVSEIAWILPNLMSSRWGSWLMMEPVTAWFLVVLATKMATVWQAWSFETVKQEEEEESSR